MCDMPIEMALNFVNAFQAKQVCVPLPTSADTVAFPILAATRRAAVDRRPTDRAAIDRYLLGGRQDPQQQTRSSGVRRPRGTNYDGCI